MLSTDAGFGEICYDRIQQSSPLICREGDMVGKALHCQEVIVGILLRVGCKIPYDHQMRALVLLEQTV